MTKSYETQGGSVKHGPAVEGLSVPNNWPDLLSLLQIHEDRHYGESAMNGLIRMYQIMSQATDKTVIRALTSPNTGEYPTFDGTLQLPEYTWDLMLKAEQHGAYEQNAREGIALRVGRGQLLRQKGVRWEYIMSQESLELPPWLGRTAMHNQLNFLVEAADDPKVSLRLLPEEVHESLPDITLIYLQGLKSLDDKYGFTVSNPFFGEIMVDRCDVRALERVWAQARKNSLSVEASRALIAEKARLLSEPDEG